MIGVEPIFALCGLTCGDRMIEVAKGADIPQLAIAANVYVPYFISAVPRDARYPGGVINFTARIPLVFRVADNAQIGQTVIFGIAVYVVDLIFRPAPVVKRPREPVVLIELGVYLGRPAPLGIRRASHGPRVFAIPNAASISISKMCKRALFPKQQARRSFVGEAIPQEIYVQFFFHN